MNIETVRKARQEMEEEIRLVVEKIISSFNAKTGLYPSSITVSLFEIQTMGSNERKFVVSEVTADVPL